MKYIYIYKNISIYIYIYIYCNIFVLNRFCEINNMMIQSKFKPWTTGMCTLSHGGDYTSLDTVVKTPPASRPLFLGRAGLKRWWRRMRMRMEGKEEG